MIPSKTALAFTFTAERLAKESKELYFWTFTFKSVPIDDDHAMRDWATLVRRLEHHFPTCQGVRVCELHKSHGIHFHVIVNQRIPIEKLNEIIHGSGHLTGRNRYLDFGRKSVTKCDAGAIQYLAKYLTKQYRDENFFGRRRRWGCLGGFKPTRCRDVVFDTPATRNREKLFGTAKVSFDVMQMIYSYSNLWGELSGWPPNCIATVLKANRTNWLKHRKDNEPF